MNQRHIQHLYWRAGFGIDINVLKKIQSKSRPQIIEELFSDSEKITPLQLNLTEFTIHKK